MPKITEELDETSNNSFGDIPSDDEFLEPESEEETEEDANVPTNPVLKQLNQLGPSGVTIVKKIPSLVTNLFPKPVLIPKTEFNVIPKPSETTIPKPIITINTKTLTATVPVPYSPPPHCKTCKRDFPDTWELNAHLIKHVKLPTLRLHRIPSDDEDDDDNQDDWSGEEDDQETEIPVKPSFNSGSNSANLLKNLGMGISIKKSNDSAPVITKLNIGDIKNILIKKSGETTPVSSEPPVPAKPVMNSAMDKLTGPGLRLTIKHSTGKEDFQIVNNQEIKKEPTMAPALNNVINKPAPPSSAVDWDTVDVKEGILEQCLNQIKTEPVSNTAPTPVSTPSFISPLAGMASMQSRIKNEITSGPGSPASPNDPIKVKSFALEQQERQTRIPQTTLPQPTIPQPIVIPKKEPDANVAIIEINGDDSDNDDIMFVDSTPATVVDKKPPVGILPPGRVQITELPSSPNIHNTNSDSARQPNLISMSLPQSNSGSNTIINSPHESVDKQHSFNWGTPTKSLENMISDKSADAMFESLLSNHRKEGNTDLLQASEYISLDTLGPQHVCDVCKVCFTDIRLLQSHRRATGHSNQLVVAGGSNGAILPAYPQSGGFNFDKMFPVKQLAETVGKLANANAASNFPHQQNITVNFQAFQPNQGYMQNPQVPPAYPGMHQAPGGYPSQPYQPYMPQQQQQPYLPSSYPQYSHPQPPMGGYPPQPGAPYAPPPQAYPPTSYPGQGPYQSQYGPSQVPPAPAPGPSASPHGPIPGPGHQSPSKVGGIKIQISPSPVSGQKLQQAPGARLATSMQGPRGPMKTRGGSVRGGRGGGPMRPGGPVRPGIRPGVQVQGQAIRGRPAANIIRTPIKRPAPPNGATMTPTKKRLDMLLPDRNDNEDCQVMSLQRDGFPMIENIKGSKEPPVQLGSGLTVTKTRVRPPSPLPVSKDAGFVANLLAQRGIRITAKPKSPSPPPVVIPNLGSGISITKKSVSTFSIPEDSADYSCSQCSKTFMSSVALSNHMSQQHSGAQAKCDQCPVSYPTFQQLHEHKRLFHSSASEMGIPVVDFSQQTNVQKLSNLGIFHFIPLANKEQGNGCFGIPIVSTKNALNGVNTSMLNNLGSNGVLSLGPVKPIPKLNY